MDILVIGAGYVGLVTATCLASGTNRVVCVDTDTRKIDILRAGNVPIYEPGLKERLKAVVDGGSLSFAENIRAGLASLADGARRSDSQAELTLIFIAVGTPQGEDGSAD